MRYLPHTPEEIREMLDRVGVADLDALFEPIPAPQRLGRDLDVEPALGEPRLMAHLSDLASKNAGANMLSFLGAGMYDHHIPPAVDQLLLRSEYYTAYTPYQAELSQGTLQVIFEFQTIVAGLFGLEVANASMYDGASALAEAAMMARRATRNTHLVVSGALHPHYLQTLRGYVRGLDKDKPQIDVAPIQSDGTTNLDALASLVRDDTAAVLMGYPNFFGCVEDLARVKEIIGDRKTLLVSATAEPYALALLKPPGDLGVDIAVGEGQALAVPPQYGGPGVGLFACRQKFVRQMPGRLCGETVDADGARGFVLTLSTREQHIRRERATSNICTNHGLIALSMAIRSAMLGKQGFVQTATRCLSLTEYLKGKIAASAALELPYSAKTFNEFVVRPTEGNGEKLLKRLSDKNILGGVPLGHFDDAWSSDVLVAVTEKHSREDLDAWLAAVES